MYTLHVSIPEPVDYNRFNNLPAARFAGRSVEIDLPSGKELFGQESFLGDLWAHPIMMRLGVGLIPALVALSCSTDNLERLAEEANIIQEHIDEIAAATMIAHNAIQPIVNNLRDAVELAKKLNGDLGVWM